MNSSLALPVDVLLNTFADHQGLWASSFSSSFFKTKLANSEHWWRWLPGGGVMSSYVQESATLIIDKWLSYRSPSDCLLYTTVTDFTWAIGIILSGQIRGSFKADLVIADVVGPSRRAVRYTWCRMVRIMRTLHAWKDTHAPRTCTRFTFNTTKKSAAIYILISDLLIVGLIQQNYSGGT